MEHDLNDISWNNYSCEYNSLSNFSSKLIHLGLGLPGLDASRFIDDNMKVLDIGCGDGTNTHIMSHFTKNTVIGIDLAKQSIEVAKKKYQKNNLLFFYRSFYEFAKNKDFVDFDLLTFFGSLDYIELNEKFFKVLSSISIKGSKCIIAKFHPMWTTLYGNDVEKECIKSYFEDGRKDYVNYGKDSCEFIRYHYSISYLLNTFDKYGWKMRKIFEPKPDFATSAFSYRGYDTDDVMVSRLSVIPMTMVLIFTRG